MNFNLWAYTIYIPFMFYITIVVGKRFYSNGAVFIAELFPNDLNFAHKINNLLLKAYYLFNLGYVVLVIGLWPKLNSWNTVIESIGYKSGLIVLMLAALHYNNMLWIYLYAKKNIKSNNHLNINRHD